MGESFKAQQDGLIRSVCCPSDSGKTVNCPDSKPIFSAQKLYSSGNELYCSLPGKHELGKQPCIAQKGQWIKAPRTTCPEMNKFLNSLGEDFKKMYRAHFVGNCCTETEKPKEVCQECSGHTCDYWAEKEGYTCKSLEKSYGCGCGGCECKLDKEIKSCEEDKCHGKTCPAWAKAGVQCSILKDVFQCTCSGCNCPDETDTSKKQCETPELKGDSYCDDKNNIADCDWDGGDCCHNSEEENLQQFIYCDACECRDPDGTQSPRKCRLPKYQNDDHCDDANNKGSCDWDGGDCCGEDVNTKYCSECLCVDPEHKGSRCITKHLGDGFCDDANNNIKCSWDKGDCCNAHHVGQFRYCQDCSCLDPTVHQANKLNKCAGKCGSDTHKDDQFCDDDNNNCGCGWDGGDCCGKTGNMNQYKYCFQCACRDPTYVAPQCPIEKFKGDGVCDDHNNIPGCNWDGGDCCKKTNGGHGDKQFKFCKKCACHE